MSLYSKSKPMHKLQLDLNHLVELFWNSAIHSSQSLFDVQGILLVQRVENKQQLQQHYQQCICRLRGNLLIYSPVSTSTSSSECHTSAITATELGLVILNKFEIKLCEESKHFEFCLHLNKSASFVEKYYFICNSRTERDQWIQSIYLASFDFLRSVHRALSDNLQEKRNNEEAQVKLSSQQHQQQQIGDRSVVSLSSHLNRFILVKCDNLRLPSTIDPFLYVKVFYRKLYLDTQWHYAASTEVIQSRSPQFNCGVHLPVHLATSIELKFELIKVLELQFDTSFLVASGYCVYRPDQQCNRCRFEVPLSGLDHNQLVGTLFYTEFSGSRFRLHKSLSFENCSSSSSSSRGKPPRRGSLRQWSSSSSLVMSIESEPINQYQDGNAQFNIFCNTLHKKFSFNVLPNKPDLIVEEFMSESKFVFLIPQILMKLYAQDDEKVIGLLEQFHRDNCSVQSNFFEPSLNFHRRLLQCIKEYLSQIIHFMSKQSFRPSTCKKEPFLQFVPVNFHKQVCRTSHDGHSASFTVFSTGAYTCHHLGFDRCGIKSILTAKYEYPKVIDCWTMLKKLMTVLHCESRINADLDAMDKLGGSRLTLPVLEPMYKVVCTLSEQLVDIISIHEVDELLSSLNVLSTGKINIFDDEFQLEPIELVYLNIKACLVAINFKLSQEQISKSDVESCNRKLKGAIESLRKIVFACYLSLFAQLSKEQEDSLYKLRFRHLSIYTQALTTLIIFIMDRVEQTHFISNIYRTRYILVQHETLLSCINDELGMLEDMSYALEEVASSTSVRFVVQNDRSQTLMPDIETFGNKIRLTFHLSHFPKEIASAHFECKVMSLQFNIGVNEHQSLAEKLGLTSFQNDLNDVNFHKLKAFITQFYGHNSKAVALVGELKEEMKRSASKNIQILHLVQEIVREVEGVRVTCCKSAKDRTGMSITLEETTFALAHVNLVAPTKSGFQTMLDTLRRDGVRIENCHKNIGARKYAFNCLQLVTYPKKFRPPSGTCSTLET